MNHMRCATMLAAALVIAASGGVSLGAPDANAPKSEWDKMWDSFHNPAPWLQMGADFRFRTEYGENWESLNDSGDPANRDVNHEFEYQRYRQRWWTKSKLSDDVAINTRLTWEFRTWDEPPKKPRAFSGDTQTTDFDEALFDTMNVSVKNVGGMPLTATVGRQDLLGFGVGWLILDGTPLDGSRTVYFDAARFSYDLADAKTKIDLIYVDQSAESDRWLEPIDDENRGVTEQDEHGAIVYVTNNSIEKTQLEGFFIYRNDNPVDHSLENPLPAAWTRKAEIFTLGGGLSGTPEEHWKYRAEAAYQFGTKHDSTSDRSIGEERDLKAFGALANLEYLFKDAMENSIHVGYEYASGDKSGTEDNEQFDLLWGEWPRWSELLIYTAANETSVAELSNLHRVNIGHKFNLNKQWTISTDYHLLWADQNGASQAWNDWTSNPSNGGLDISNDDYFRGQLLTLWARYKFTSQLAGHLLGEYFMPGDYFKSPTDDSAFFLRFNLEYTF